MAYEPWLDEPRAREEREERGLLTTTNYCGVEQKKAARGLGHQMVMAVALGFAWRRVSVRWLWLKNLG